ncbi:hypothetical protein RB601_004464 [Gaeumannomyces tritici]
MGPRGRFAPRGGSRGRGSSRGRGGGRGGRGGRGGSKNLMGKRRFDSSRVEEKKEDSDDESSQDEPPSEDEESGVGSNSEGEEEEDKTVARPYVALLRSLTEASGPKAKRRKLDHPEKAGEPSSEDEGKDVDVVEETEEVEEDDDEVSDSNDEDTQDGSDPFASHFAAPDEAAVTTRLAAMAKNEWVTKKVATKPSRIIIMAPKTSSDAQATALPSVRDPSALTLKPKLKEAITTQRPEFDASEQALAAPLFQYLDTLYCQRTVANGDSLRRLVCLHALNHIFKTRDRVIKNSAKLAREDANPDLELRDQGFTRPKVLMLLPTRQSCAKMVDMIYSLADVDQQENRKRFNDSYVEKEGFKDDKPADFKDLFDGNSDDMFRLGVKFTRKTIKYFSQFYSSDILIASPLGLRMAIGSTEEKNLDYDFLSSIEMVIVDQADAILMQNWEHVEYIFEHMNLQPKDAHGCDFSRVRSWYLDGQAKHFRQNVVLSAFNTPELSELLRSHCHNWAGRARVQPEYQGLIQQLGGVVPHARQTFSRFDAPSIAAEPDARFEYFTKAVVPALARRAASRDASAGGTLVFVPSYMDFVRVRNYFAADPAAASLSFGAVSDHSGVAETSRARSHFLTGRHRVLLYTERAHHFWRHRIRGVRRVVMYGLPDNPAFYREVAGGYLGRSEQDGIIGSGQGTVRVLFSRYDVMKLERVVGTQRVGKMLTEKGDTFDFV